jgi:hypothetical protein
LAMPFQTRLTPTKPGLPLPNKHGSQVRAEGWRQCCQTKHKKFPYQPTCDVSLLSRHRFTYIQGFLGNSQANQLQMKSNPEKVFIQQAQTIT